MKKSFQLAFLVFVLITVSLAGCGQTPTPAAPAFPDTAVPSDPSEAAHEIYAGFTGDPAMPFVMIHQSGESLVVTQDVNSSSISGVVWTSEQGESIVIYADGEGRPQIAVAGNEMVLYSNYTYDSVDVLILHADGSREMFTSRLDVNFLNSLKSERPPVESMISYSPLSAQPRQFDKWFYMKTGLYMFGVATCAASVGTALTVGLAVPIIGIPLLAAGCSGTILGTAIRVGNILHMDVTGLENLNNGINGVKCVFTTDLPACASLIVNETERQEKMAAEIVAHPVDYGLQPEGISPEPAATEAPLPTEVVHASLADGATCGVVELSEPTLYNQSLVQIAIFKPLGSTDSSEWWEFHPLGVSVQSLDNQFVFFDSLAGNHIRIWDPQVSGITIYGIGGYEIVDSSCNPLSMSQAPADGSQATQAQISDEISYAALRLTPGYSDKDNTVDLLANVPAGAVVQILGGPAQADGLNWWNVSWNGTTGWMADHTGSGKTILIFLQ
jgi:hypothetical protein